MPYLSIEASERKRQIGVALPFLLIDYFNFTEQRSSFCPARWIDSDLIVERVIVQADPLSLSPDGK